MSRASAGTTAPFFSSGLALAVMLSPAPDARWLAAVRSFVMGRLHGQDYDMWRDHSLEYLRNCLAQWWQYAPLHENEQALSEVKDVLDVLTSVRIDAGEFVRMSLPDREPHMLAFVPDQLTVKDKMANVLTISILRDACEAAGKPQLNWDRAADALMLTMICTKAGKRTRSMEKGMD